MAKAPPSVMVLSILGIIFGGFGVLAAPCSIGMLFVDFGPPNPAYAAIRSDPTALAITLVLYLTNSALALLLLVASIASIKLIPWGRKAMIVYAIALLVVTVLGNTFNGIFVMPRMFEGLAAAPGPGGPAAAAAGKIFGVIAMVFGVLFAVAIASVILYFFTRTPVINAFKGIVPDDPNTFPVSYPDQANNPRT